MVDGVKNGVGSSVWYHGWLLVKNEELTLRAGVNFDQAMPRLVIQNFKTQRGLFSFMK